MAGDGEAPPPHTTTGCSRRGGWSTMPFILATVAGLALSGGGWMNNLIVFLINEFNIKSIDAAQINNGVIGLSNFSPVVAAILADSFLGCFSVICISSFISVLGLILLVLTVTIDGLRPYDSLRSPSGFQYAILFTALALVSIGFGGTRFTLATMGANQFTKPQHQSSYFNWYFSVIYFSSFVSATGIVYVEDNMSWGFGFGICIAANVVGLVVFFLGKRYYFGETRRGSPFTSLARVVVASVRKRKAVVTSQNDADYYYGDDGFQRGMTSSFRLLNAAAIMTEGDLLPNGTIARPWRLCSVQQVEDLKDLIRILPLWSTNILLTAPTAIQLSLTVLQALNTNRHVCSLHFQIPAGSMIVFMLIATSISVSLIDRCLWPMWRKMIARNPTPLQQIGIGHMFNILAMAVSALVELKRRGAGPTKMSVLWLVPQMVMVGISEAFQFPGQVGFFYREFPACLKSMATAMVAMLIGTAYYLSTAMIDFVKRATGWLPDNIDEGRLDNVYWVLVALGVVNFGYYLVCSWFYKYKSNVVGEEDGIIYH